MRFIKPSGFILLLAAVCQPLHAVQLGQTISELVTESGAPTFEDHAKNTVQYRWDLWKMDIQFHQGKIASITYTKTDDLTEAEIAQLLKSRSNGKTWVPMGFQSMMSKNWMRSDHAVAVFDPKFPRSMRFSGGTYQPLQAIPTLSSSRTQSTTPDQFTASILPITARPPTSTKTPVPASASEHTTPGIPTLNVFFLGACLIAALLALSRKIGASPDTPLPLTTGSWQPPTCRETTLASLTWEQFEMLTGEIYRRKGWEVELCAGTGPDGGVDLRLRKDGQLALVQCKHWKVYQVGGPAIREFFGVLTSENASRGIFITSGRFTRDALSFAAGKPIDMIDRQTIQALVAEVSQPGENLYDVKRWESNFNLQAHFTIPICPFCSTTMVSRTGRRSGNSFWGCANYPSCKGQRKRRTDLQEV